MTKTTKIGIIICDRYRDCGGGKCLRSMKNREGAFSSYSEDEELELVGYSTCGGCPGGNIEHVPEEMIRNGAEIIHLATGFIVGYPPCPHIEHFRSFIEKEFKIKVVFGTHPIPEKYVDNHAAFGSWDSDEWKEMIKPAFSDFETRLAYN